MIKLTENLSENAKILGLPTFTKKDLKDTCITMHWSAGTYDQAFPTHYNFCIMGDGGIIVGVNLKKQIPVAKSNYAAHTRGANSSNIGISMMCMAGAEENRSIHGDFGKYRPKKEQIQAMILLAATLCDFYKIPAAKERVLAHCEWTTIKNKLQRGRWDISVLPGQPYKKNPDGSFESMNFIRSEINKKLTNGGVEAPKSIPAAEFRKLYDFGSLMPNGTKKQALLTTLNHLRNELDLISENLVPIEAKNPKITVLYSQLLTFADLISDDNKKKEFISIVDKIRLIL